MSQQLVNGVISGQLYARAGFSFEYNQNKAYAASITAIPESIHLMH